MKKTENPKDKEQPEGREKYLVTGPGGGATQARLSGADA